MTRAVLRDAGQLAAAALISTEAAPEIARVAARFAVAITPEMVDLIAPDADADPIALQFVPHSSELALAPEERPDPIGDERFSPLPGIVHRYPDRVLLKPLHACAVYCRFCFRREAVGPGSEALTEAELDAALDYIRTRPKIWEVVVTGGDPLLMAPRRLRNLTDALGGIPHLGVLRIHTRIPIVDPTRVTSELVDALATDKALFIVVHANHPRELTPSAAMAIKAFVGAGIPVLSQTVLLAGVNDDPVILDSLLRGLVALRVKPYYLHHCDLAPGTARFRTTLAAGQALMRRLRGRLSGIAQPQYVLDLPGGAGKVPVGPCYARPGDEAHSWIVEDPDGSLHPYPPERDA